MPPKPMVDRRKNLNQLYDLFKKGLLNFSTGPRLPLESIPYMPKDGPSLLDRNPVLNSASDFQGKKPLDLFIKRIGQISFTESELHTLFNAIQITSEYVNREETGAGRPARDDAVSVLVHIPGMTRVTANFLYDIGIYTPMGLDANVYDANGRVISTGNLVDKTRELYNKICENRMVDPYLASSVWSSILAAVAYQTFAAGPPICPWP